MATRADRYCMGEGGQLGIPPGSCGGAPPAPPIPTASRLDDATQIIHIRVIAKLIF